MTTIDTIEALEAIYARPGVNDYAKDLDHVSDHYRAFIEASPFVALATSGPEGLDCSPRGDAGAAVRIADPRTVMMPDRRGNNRCDSLRNIVRDPRAALLFLVPGSGNTLRLNGRAHLSLEPELLESFAMDGKAPRCVIVIAVEAVYFQCARAIVRSQLWDPQRHVDPKSLPTPGQMLAAVRTDGFDQEAYDKAWPERARQTMW
jgi:PPOX class probable FMN-dependent enzyme